MLPNSPDFTTESLYRDHHSWLRTWLRRRLGCSDVAADLAQDTFVKLIEARMSQLHSPRAFLLTLARRLMISHFRHREVERAWLETIAHLPEDLAPSPETRAIVIETLLEIDALLDGLPPKVKAAFLMARLDGLPYTEIATRLGVTVSSVNQYMARAIREFYFPDSTLPTTRFEHRSKPAASSKTEAVGEAV
ncbi:MAG: sigma-70 family RNA polymerase sigma factor [Cellvibrio sp.]|uniref:sigma-70 family RNA polymerase sigma factor n=1 Tax=Cellvibrio sp. TaxID=1965322 RepID=UPI0031B50ED6